MTGFLASVATLDEMEIARSGGADIVDLKDPSKGALGAWDDAGLRAAVARWRGWTGGGPMLSATIGDQPMEPAIVREAAEVVAATGVSLVKLGIFAGGDSRGCFDALAPLASQTKLIAVFFGDLDPDPAMLDRVAAAGFHGAMLDTADKSGGGLRAHMNQAAIGRFVSRAKSLGLLTGLAGSLKPDDVPALTRFSPDYLGFRGALCAGGRTGGIELARVAHIAEILVDRSRAA